MTSPKLQGLVKTVRALELLSLKRIAGTYLQNISLGHILATYPRDISLQHNPGTYPWDTSLQITLGHITAINPGTNIFPEYTGIQATYLWNISPENTLGHILGTHPFKQFWDISPQQIPGTHIFPEYTGIPGTYPFNFTSRVLQPPFYILTSVTSSQTCVTCTLP